MTLQQLPARSGRSRDAPDPRQRAATTERLPCDEDDVARLLARNELERLLREQHRIGMRLRSSSVREAVSPSYVVLMDVQMPELDGLEATRRIRASQPTGASPYIIALTANATADDRAACIAAGMDDYVSKPIRVEELVDALGRGAAAARSARNA